MCVRRGERAIGSAEVRNRGAAGLDFLPSLLRGWEQTRTLTNINLNWPVPRLLAGL